METQRGGRGEGGERGKGWGGGWGSTFLLCRVNVCTMTCCSAELCSRGPINIRFVRPLPAFRKITNEKHCCCTTAPLTWLLAAGLASTDGRPTDRPSVPSKNSFGGRRTKNTKTCYAVSLVSPVSPILLVSLLIVILLIVSLLIVIPIVRSKACYVRAVYLAFRVVSTKEKAQKNSVLYTAVRYHSPFLRDPTARENGI